MPTTATTLPTSPGRQRDFAVDGIWGHNTQAQVDQRTSRLGVAGDLQPKYAACLQVRYGIASAGFAHQGI